MTDPTIRQREYYGSTAAVYDGMHSMGEHLTALRHTAAYMRDMGARSVLDTGCGTGLALRYLIECFPDLEWRGNDPSEALLRVATERHGLAADRLDAVGSQRLPYADGTFDAVVETGVLHHVPDPAVVVDEMLRVARQAVFISDENQFGLGHPLARIGKLGLRAVGHLDRVNRWRRGGTDWYYTDGDGVGWSYSVFDSLPALRQACAEVIVIPTLPRNGLSDAFPLLGASHCLAIGLKQAAFERA